MTHDEHVAWMNETKRSEGAWRKDSIQSQDGRLLLYKGGENGMFIEVDDKGEMIMGTYEGAMPHIGEALFRIVHKRQFNSKTHACEHLAILGIAA